GLYGSGHAVAVGSGAGVMEVVSQEFVFVIPADGYKALVRVVPRMVAASADVGHLVFAAGGRDEVISICAGAVAGIVRQGHVREDVLRHLAQAIGGDHVAGEERTGAAGDDGVGVED